MRQSAILRYYTNYNSTEMDVLRIEMANQYLEALNQPLFTHSAAFWEWWNCQWSNVDRVLEQRLIGLGDNVRIDTAREMYEQAHHIKPFERYPNARMSDAIIHQVYEHFNTVEQ